MAVEHVRLGRVRKKGNENITTGALDKSSVSDPLPNSLATGQHSVVIEDRKILIELHNSKDKWKLLDKLKDKFLLKHIEIEETPRQ